MVVKLISILRVIVGLVFVVSGFGKLVDINEFVNIVRTYGFFPNFLVLPFSISLSLFEILLGAMFLLKIWVRFVSVSLLLLSILFFFALIYGFYYLGLDEYGRFGGILSISGRFANLLKSVILIVSISLYILIERLYSFKFFFRFFIFALLFSSLLILGFVYSGHIGYDKIDLSFLGDQIDSNSYYLLIIFSPLECQGYLSSMIPVWNKIDSVYKGIKVLGIAYSGDERLVNYVVNAYRFKFEVRRFNNIPIDFEVSPVEILVDGFGKVYYRVDGVKATKAHVSRLITAINKISKQTK